MNGSQAFADILIDIYTCGSKQRLGGLAGFTSSSAAAYGVGPLLR